MALAAAAAEYDDGGVRLWCWHVVDIVRRLYPLVGEVLVIRRTDQTHHWRIVATLSPLAVNHRGAGRIA